MQNNTVSIDNGKIVCNVELQNMATILGAIIDENHSIDDFEVEDILETLEDMLSSQADDFTIEFDGNEYRIISDSEIWSIYVDAIKNIVEDCYDFKLNNIPDFVAFEIDWEKTAQNAYVDGYGHTFSSYDHSEIEVGGYWVFRTN